MNGCYGPDEQLTLNPDPPLSRQILVWLVGLAMPGMLMFLCGGCGSVGQSRLFDGDERLEDLIRIDTEIADLDRKSYRTDAEQDMRAQLCARRFDSVLSWGHREERRDPSADELAAITKTVLSETNAHIVKVNVFGTRRVCVFTLSTDGLRNLYYLVNEREQWRVVEKMAAVE